MARLCASGSDCKQSIKSDTTTKPALVTDEHTYCAACRKDMPRKTTSQLALDPPYRDITKETRGRKPLALSTAAKTDRLKIQKSIATKKNKQKKNLLQELGSESHPDFQVRWADIVSTIEIEKYHRIGKPLGPNFSPPRKTIKKSKVLSTGLANDGKFEWSVYMDAKKSSYYILVSKVAPNSHTKSVGQYSKRGLSRQEADEITKSLSKNGFKKDEFQSPISSYFTTAASFLHLAHAGNLTRSDVQSYQRAISLGFVLAIYVRDAKIETVRQDKTWGLIEKIYRVLSDVRISPNTITPATIEGWLEEIINSPAESEGRITARGGVISVEYSNRLIKTLENVFDRLMYFPDVFPWADKARKLIEDRKSILINRAEKQGRLSSGVGYRCLQLQEIAEILKAAPSIHHVSLVILGLSTGLRPEDLKEIKETDWDSVSGMLFFREGRLNRKLKGRSRKGIGNPHTSTVVKFILANRCYFDPNMRPIVVKWMDESNEPGMKKWPNLLSHAEEAGTPIATMRDFRSTAATMLAFIGVPILEIQRLFGHVTGVTTSNFYILATPPDGGAVSKEPFITRGNTYFGNPLVKVPGIGDYKDENAWDTFLLVQFISELKRRKLLELQALGIDTTIRNLTWNSWIEKEVLPKLTTAIHHHKIQVEKWSKRLGKQELDMFEVPNLDTMIHSSATTKTPEITAGEIESNYDDSEEAS